MEKENKYINEASEAVVAAIAMAIYEATELHDEENTTLTIKQATQMYTPWSSKIHTMRQIPVLNRR